MLVVVLRNCLSLSLLSLSFLSKPPFFSGEVIYCKTAIFVALNFFLVLALVNEFESFSWGGGWWWWWWEGRLCSGFL